MRNMGKVPFKFKFDLIIETVDKIAASGDVVVVWERGTRADGTKPAKVDKTTRKASFENEKISSEITLFKNQPSERKFLDKVFKIAVKTGTIDGKTMGKIHLNFADYAEVPSGSKRISAELNNGATLIASILCTFLGMGKALPKGAKGESADGEDADDGDGENQDDTSASNDDVPGSFMKNKLAGKITKAASKRTIGRRGKDDDGVVGNGISAAETAEKLRKENNRLKKQIEDLERQGAFSNRTGSTKTAEETRALRNEVQDLKNALAREPVYADVVKELKEAKMALALLHLEKEEFHLELMKYQRGEIASPTSTISR